MCRCPTVVLLCGCLGVLAQAGGGPPTPGAPPRAERDPAPLGVPFDRYTTADRLGRTITFYLSHVPQGAAQPLPLAVFVQGSGATSVECVELDKALKECTPTMIKFDIEGAELDALSDPRDESKWSTDDLITMGFLNTPELVALLQDTPKLADLDLDEYDAIMVAGGQAPMFSFRGNEQVHDALRRFYESEKPVCVYCHGTAALVDLQLSDGTYLVGGKTVIGFANVEEDFSDAFVGQKVMPFRIEDELRPVVRQALSVFIETRQDDQIEQLLNAHPELRPLLEPIVSQVRAVDAAADP